MISRRRFAMLAAAAAFAAFMPMGLPGGALRAAGPAPTPRRGPGARPLVGFAQDHMANDWRAAQVAEVARALAAADQPVDFVHTDARASTAQQVYDIDSLVAAGADVLITSPRDPALLTPAIARAHREGVKVVLLTRRVVGEDYTAFISPDDAGIALQAARVIAGSLDGRGRVLVLQGIPGVSTTVARTEGFLEEMANYPGMTVAALKPANFLRSDAIRAVEAALAEGIAFDALYAQSDSMAAGARLALRKAGIDPAGVPIVGIDYIAEARAAIRVGEQAASFTYPTCGAQGAAAALALLRAEAVEREVVVPSVMVTPYNVDAVDPIF